MSEEGDYERRGMRMRWHACSRVRPSVRLSCPGDLGRAAAGGLLEFDDPRHRKDLIVLPPIICRWSLELLMYDMIFVRSLAPLCTFLTSESAPLKEER